VGESTTTRPTPTRRNLRGISPRSGHSSRRPSSRSTPSVRIAFNLLGIPVWDRPGNGVNGGGMTQAGMPLTMTLVAR